MALAPGLNYRCLRFLVAVMVVGAAALTGLGCPADPPPTPAPRCPEGAQTRAGDEAWVKAALPVLLGRKAYGTREVHLLTALVQQTDRETVAHWMTQMPGYRARWAEWLIDMGQVDRLTENAPRACMGPPIAGEKAADAARWVRDHGPLDGPFSTPFNSSDLMFGVLDIDDLGPWLQANLFTMVGRPPDYCPNTPWDRMESLRRFQLSTRFLSLYANRTMECLSCHNGTFSTTDGPTPETDRFWPIPGDFEAALFGEASGRSLDEVGALFRLRGVLSKADIIDEDEREEVWPDDTGTAVAPWGMDPSCGTFITPADIPVDPLGVDAWLGGSHGDQAGIWAVESMVRRGTQALREGGPDLVSQGTLDPATALAWLSASSLVDQLWLEAHGHRLTIGHHYPRTEAQRTQLDALTRRFIQDDFSLRSILIAIVADPDFLPVAPEDACSENPAYPYDLPRIAAPWSEQESDPARRGNGVGDGVSRVPGRSLLTMAAAALDWPAPPRFVELEEAGPLLAAGAWIHNAMPGFRGVAFQARVVWEEVMGDCRVPWWDANQGDAPADWIDGLLAAIDADSAASPWTHRELAQVMKDRILNAPTLEDWEEPLLAAYLETDDLNAPLSVDGPWRGRVRELCGLFLSTPQFALVGIAAPDQPEAPARIVPGGDAQTLCAVVAAAAAATGRTVTCSDGYATVGP